jgi:hypothetical protein
MDGVSPADHRCMASEPNERWTGVDLDETLVGRSAGGSTAQSARGLRPEPLWSLLARFLGIDTDGRASRRGANGERLTGWWLGRLPTGWHLFHDLRGGENGERIDHLVIGPAGTFTINTANLTGKVWIGPKSILHNRRRTDFLPKASAEARRASRLLSDAVGRRVEVRAVLAILADEWTIKQRPADVYVAAPRGARDWILKQPALLRPDEVMALAVAASKPSTWIVA